MNKNTPWKDHRGGLWAWCCLESVSGRRRCGYLNLVKTCDVGVHPTRSGVNYWYPMIFQLIFHTLMYLIGFRTTQFLYPIRWIPSKRHRQRSGIGKGPVERPAARRSSFARNHEAWARRASRCWHNQLIQAKRHEQQKAVDPAIALSAIGICPMQTIWLAVLSQLY